MALRGIHSKQVHGRTVEWLTPKSVIESLGSFDLDPCGHAGHFFKTAANVICPPVDGLGIEWKGRVWLNPPYGQRVLVKWISRLAAHGNGIALVPARTEVREWFFPFIWEAADAVLFKKGRVSFHRPDGTLWRNAGFGSVFVAYGRSNAAALSSCGIEGKFISLR